MPATEARAGWRAGALAFILLGPLALIFTRGPIGQDPAYHLFADTRAVLGVPNFLDVGSNVAFLVVGIAGLTLCLGRRRPALAASWSTLFLGTALVFFGSAWYHLAPSSATLLWDRLPMTVAFMGLFAALVSEHAGEGLERFLLVPALVLGIASALWWHYTDDLRLYVWVQFAPLLCIVFVMLLYPRTYSHRGYLMAGLVLYGFAKLAEFRDREIFAATGDLFSGHTLKHLLAACAVLCLYLMLRQRSRI